MSSDIPDQKVVWDKKHSNNDQAHMREIVMPFAKVAEEYIEPKSNVLELGCGTGSSAIYFAGAKGCEVTATDISDVVIEQNKQYFSEPHVNFEVLDMQQPFPYADDAFDVVFANLAIHYFTHEDTKKVVTEIARVLKQDGIFAFACKSVNDFHYGGGEKIEENVFVSTKGHVRHLFSIQYTEELIKDLFNIELLEEVTEEYENQKSKIIRCIARKK